MYPYFYYVPIYVIVLCFGIFLVGKLFSSVSFSKSVAMILYSRLEIVLSLVLILIRSYLNYKEADYLYRTKYGDRILAGNISEYFSYIICVYAMTFVFLLLSLIAWYFVSCFWFAAFGYQQNFLQYPFMSFFGEIIKTLIYFILLGISIFIPVYAFPIWGAMVIVTIILYPKCNKMLQYFYFQDIVTFRYMILDRGKIRSHTGTMYIPKELKAMYPGQNMCVAFMIRKDRFPELPFRKFDKVFVTYKENQLVIYGKSFFGKHFREYQIPKSEYFYIVGHENFAVFTIDGPKEEIIHLFKRPNKDFCIYISKACETGFTEIVNRLNAVDYESLSAELLKNRKLY